MALNMSLEYPEWLWGLLLVAGLILLAFFSEKQKQKRMSQWMRPENRDKLLSTVNKEKLRQRSYFLYISLILFLIALSNPRVPGKEITIEHKGSDIILALDISQSMLVQDVAPSRLSRAVRFSTELIRAIPGERYGLIFFAGSAHTQMPLSTDARVAMLFLQNADPIQASHQGTAIGDAIDLAVEMFDDKPGRGKLLLIISDGEDHDSKTAEKVTLLKENNIYLVTVGVGTLQGGVVPDKSLGRDAIIRDEDGQAVISKFYPEFLQKLSREANGNYFDINEAGQQAEKIRDLVSRMEKGELSTQSYQDFEPLFQYPLLLALLFFCLYMIWPLYPLKRIEV